MKNINRALMHEIAVRAIDCESFSSLARELDISNQTVFNYLSRLEIQGVIVKTPEKLYIKGPNYDAFLAENAKYARKKMKPVSEDIDATPITREDVARIAAEAATQALSQFMSKQAQVTPQIQPGTMSVQQFVQEQPIYLDEQNGMRPKGMSRKGFQTMLAISHYLVQGIHQADVARRLKLPIQNVSYYAIKAEQLGIIKMTQKDWMAFYQPGEKFNLVKDAKFATPELIQKLGRGAPPTLFKNEVEWHGLQIVLPIRKKPEKVLLYSPSKLQAWNQYIAGNLRKCLKTPQMSIIDEGENIVLQPEKFFTQFHPKSVEEARARCNALALQAVDLLRRYGYDVDLGGLDVRHHHAQNRVKDSIDPTPGTRTVTGLGRPAVSLYGNPQPREAHIWTGENSPGKPDWMDLETDCAFSQKDINLMPVRVRDAELNTRSIISMTSRMVEAYEQVSTMTLKDIAATNSNVARLVQVLNAVQSADAPRQTWS